MHHPSDQRDPQLAHFARSRRTRWQRRWRRHGAFAGRGIGDQVRRLVALRIHRDEVAPRPQLCPLARHVALDCHAAAVRVGVGRARRLGRGERGESWAAQPLGRFGAALEVSIGLAAPTDTWLVTPGFTLRVPPKGFPRKLGYIGWGQRSGPPAQPRAGRACPVSEYATLAPCG